MSALAEFGKDLGIRMVVFFEIWGYYTNNMTYKCTCSDATVHIYSSKHRCGIGLGGDWQKEWSLMWGGITAEI